MQTRHDTAPRSASSTSVMRRPYETQDHADTRSADEKPARSCDRCNSFQPAREAWGPRWRTCCAPTLRPPAHRTAGPDHQSSCGPCPGPQKTRRDQAGGDRRRTGVGLEGGSRMRRSEDRSTIVGLGEMNRGPRGRRRTRPASWPAGSRRQGSPYHGGRCAAAESGAPTRR